ncbi:hypothetical protein QJS63_28595 [Pseudomonas juntendi]|nr:hypothetical protein QJS63_28595 [Pseudomonas juntendi]
MATEIHTMSRETGGPAFPTQINNSGITPIKGFNGEEIKPQTFSAYPGMNLRDYFAARFAAAQATATSADSNFINPGYVDPRDGRPVAQKIAETSYELADAMLAARVKP